MQYVIIDFTDETQQEIAGVIGPFSTVEEADLYDEDTGQRGMGHIIVPLSEPETFGTNGARTPCEGACKGTGILYGSSTGSPAHWDVDNIARCDACFHEPGPLQGKYSDDYEAAKALASGNANGAWLVYVNDLNMGLPATEAPQLYIRNYVADVASLQRSLLDEAPMDIDDVPGWVVMTEFINPA